MTDYRPVPLQHQILYKDKYYMVKDEFGNFRGDDVRHVLKLENQDFKKKY